MKLVVLTAALAAILVHAGSAQTGCLGQLQPIKPATACMNTSLLCLCGPNGNYCHWQWVCNPETNAPPQTTLDPSIPLAGRPAPINDPAETAIRLEQLRQMQQQRSMAGAPQASASWPAKEMRMRQKELMKEMKREADFQRKQEKLAKQIEREEAAKRDKQAKAEKAKR
jgi:hypothetical protein